MFFHVMMHVRYAVFTQWVVELFKELCIGKNRKKR